MHASVAAARAVPEEIVFAVTVQVERGGGAPGGAGYALPSPDGKRVALMIPLVSTNVWSLEGF